MMPKKRNGEIPIPAGWDVDHDFDGKPFFIDHNTHTTTWVDPRDRYTKPQNFADCVGDELPYGWEQAFDPQVGVYYINHISHTNQLEDPRLQWRQEQERMLKEYMVHANDDLVAKKEIYNVKQQRLAIAQEEVQHLKDTLAGWKASRTSLNSSSSIGSTKYDPDLLKADVALAKTRVARIKRELALIRSEMNTKEKGLETLSQIDHKMEQSGGYTLDQAHEVLSRIKDIKGNLKAGEREKNEIMQTLARINSEFLHTKLQSSSSPDVSTLSIPQEKLSTASQTDLTGENVGQTTQWGEMLRLRMRYEEAKKQVALLQQQLARVEEQIIPGQSESDRDRLLLIQEKEQLLRELRSINHMGRGEEEMNQVRQQVVQLEQDLQAAMQLSSKQIEERLKLNDQKSAIMHQLTDAVRLTAYLESRLKSLSTLSMSSGSSLGSLGSLSASSSKGSLTSLSVTDIYGQTSVASGDTNLQDLHRRVEKLLQGHSVSPIPERPNTIRNSTERLNAHSNTTNHYVNLPSPQTSDVPYSLASSNSSLSPPVSPYEIGPPPSYEEHIERQRQGTLPTTAEANSLQIKMAELSLAPQSYETNSEFTNAVGTVGHSVPRPAPSLSLPGECTDLGTASVAPVAGPARRTLYATDSSERISNPPLSPISETSSGMCNNVSGGNTRSVSAAVSDESVAGDSGVFEASGKRSSDLDDVFDRRVEAAQVQMKLKYEGVEGKLHIGIEQARNLSALMVPDNCTVCIKAALLPPMPRLATMVTQMSGNTDNPKYSELFKVSIPENKLPSKTLQVNVWSVNVEGEEECLGSAQVSLADFDAKTVSVRWYNVLSFRFMQAEPQQPSVTSSQTSLNNSGPSSLPTHSPLNDADKTAQLLRESSARLQESITSSDKLQSMEEDSSSIYKSTPAVQSLREESSDESTIISSQTSTLTRNQGPEDMGSHKEGSPGMGGDSSESPEDEEDEQLGYMTLETSMLAAEDIPEEEEEEMTFTEDGTIKKVTCDKTTNTENALARQRAAAANAAATDDASRSSTIKRSQTFSPAARGEEDRICKLNRSDSDSSVPKYRRLPFQRNSMERRSLRWKKAPMVVHHTRSKSSHETAWTSLDLELDLQASERKLAQQAEELSRLRELRQKMEDAQASGSTEVPSWLTENEKLQQFLIEAEKMCEKRSKIDKRAEHLLRRFTKEAHKLRQGQKHSDAMSFREKMVFFTSTNLSIPSLQVESDTEGDDVRIVKAKSSHPMEV